MSTPAAPQPAAPAAAVPPAPAPVVPVSPAPAPAAPATPEAKTPSRGSTVFKLLAEESASEPGKPAEKKEPKAAEPAPAKADPAAPAADPEKPIKATKKTAISKRPELPKETPAATPAPATPAAVAPVNDAEWEAQLVDEERQLISDAEEAEKHLPSRKGLKDQARKFIKEHQKYLAKHDDTEDGADGQAAYEAWRKKNFPGLSETEQRTVSEARIAARVAKPFEEKTASLEHELFVRDHTPKIERDIEETKSALRGQAYPEEIIEFAKKNGVEATRTHYGDEIRVANTIIETAAADRAELLRLDTFHPKTGRPLAAEAVNESDPRFEQHQRLRTLAEHVTEEFKQAATKEADLIRDGKWFVTRKEWYDLPASARSQYWTFSLTEIAQRSMAMVKPAVDQAIQRTRADMEARGWTRRPFVPPAPPAVPATPTRSASAPTPTPVPAPSAPVPGGTPTAGSRLLNALTAG